MPQPHMVALARSVVRCPCTRSTGCLRMPQLGTNVTTGPLSRKASLVWICKRLASTQKTSRASPTSSTGSGLLVRRELATRLGRALRRLLAILEAPFVVVWVWGRDGSVFIQGVDVQSCQRPKQSPQFEAEESGFVETERRVLGERVSVMAGLPP